MAIQLDRAHRLHIPIMSLGIIRGTYKIDTRASSLDTKQKRDGARQLLGWLALEAPWLLKHKANLESNGIMRYEGRDYHGTFTSGSLGDQIMCLEHALATAERKAEGGGYRHCKCRDCFQVTMTTGDPKDDYCHACIAADCQPGEECEAAHSYCDDSSGAEFWQAANDTSPVRPTREQALADCLPGQGLKQFCGDCGQEY